MTAGRVWAGRKVVVTGAGGFIGSHLTERLVELGADTRSLIEYNSMGSWGWLDQSPVRQHIDATLGDVRDRDSVRGAIRGADVVFHLAALIAIPYSYQSPLSFITTNIEGTANVLLEAHAAGVERVIHTSTSEVYGTARYVPMDEEHPLQAQSPYAASKIGADKLAEAYAASFGLQVTTVRPFNTYGPRQSARAVIPTIITQVLSEPEVLLGNMSPERDFNYVLDTVESFVLAGASDRAIGRVMNVGTGEKVSIRELAAHVMKVVGREVPITQEEQRARPGASEVDCLQADSSLARELIGWEPRHTLEEGLQLTVDWIKGNISSFHPGTYAV